MLFVIRQILRRPPEELLPSQRGYWAIQKMGLIFARPEFRFDRWLFFAGWGLGVGAIGLGVGVAMVFGTPIVPTP
jgi:hypothetical protein